MFLKSICMQLFTFFFFFSVTQFTFLTTWYNNLLLSWEEYTMDMSHNHNYSSNKCICKNKWLLNLQQNINVTCLALSQWSHLFTLHLHSPLFCYLTVWVWISCPCSLLSPMLIVRVGVILKVTLMVLMGKVVLCCVI